MKKNKPEKKAKNIGKSREDRLKQALKANLARRKAQARARDTAEVRTPESKG